ncbi:CaiB/BaiF CoA transferase family protein [Roseivivax sp.]
MPQPLNGLVILDLTQARGGPFAALSLGELGAKVIKVERPGTGDAGRAVPPFKSGKSALFAAQNHGKASIALDLRSETDRVTFERLLARADVLLENFRPGALERLGYGWEALHAAYPGLIYGALSGFGQTGPEATRPGYSGIAAARAGQMGQGHTGQAEVAGLYLAQGVLAALYDRSTTGRGRRVDVSLLDTEFALLGPAFAAAAAGSKTPEEGAPPPFAPVETLEAADGAFVLAAASDKLFEKLCIALALPLSEDPRFARAEARCANARLLKRLIEAVTLEQTRSHWLQKLTAAGIPAAPIQSLDQAIKDPQLLARTMVVDVLDRNGRKAHLAPGNPIKISGAEDRSARGPAPDLDGNRGEVLRWLDEA